MLRSRQAAPEGRVMDKPPYLYKYCSAARAAQIIRDLTFYFAPVSKLNDLYEFRVRSLYRETQESRRRVFAKQLVNQGWFDTTEEAIESIDTPELIASADSAYSYFLETLNGQLAAIMQHSGVTCFSAHRNNQRMWGTYGDAHAGAVIEFTTSSEASSFADHLMPVLYAADKPDLCPSEFLTADLKLDQWLCGALCCIKHYHWRDEAEWRLLLLASSAQTDKDRIVPFERTAITR